MIGMGFAMDVFAAAPEVPVLWSPMDAADCTGAALGDEDGTVLFQTARRGLFHTLAGPVRFAVAVQVQQSGAGRLVAVMLLATTSETARWTLRRVSVPVDARRPAEAAQALRGLLPDMLGETPDGTTMLGGVDGVVRAEVVSISGRLAQARRSETAVRGVWPGFSGGRSAAGAGARYCA